MLLVEPREVKLTTRSEISVRRTLPHAKLRRVGAWVFLDHFGPTPQVEGMTVAAHPHSGLQTVTWLFEGQIHHRDSVGSSQVIRPGQLNLMTSGAAVAHSEKALVSVEHENLRAVQLWVALPNSAANEPANFEHQSELPGFQTENLQAKVLIGELGGVASPAKVFSPLVAAQLDVSGSASIDLNPDWEYALLAVEGGVTATSDNGETGEAAETQLLYLPTSASRLDLKPICPNRTEHSPAATVLLIGGEPFDEQIIMWWNFIERTPEAIIAKRERWNSRETHPSPGFEHFADEVGGWIPAPELPNVTLRPRGRD